MADDSMIGLEVLVVDGDAAVVTGLKKLLGEDGFVVSGVQDTETARQWLEDKFFAVVLCDLDTPTPNGGLEVVKAVQTLSPASAVIVMSPRKAYDAALDAFRAGADDVVAKSPDQVPYLRDRVKNAAQQHQREADRDELFERIVGAHEEFLKKMMELFKQTVSLQDKLQGREDDVTVDLPECRVLVVDTGEAVAGSLQKNLGEGQGWKLTHCQTGGEALDYVGRQLQHIVAVHQELMDLPSSMVTKTVKSLSSESIVLLFSSPGDPPGKVVIVESSGQIPVIEEFRNESQMLSSLETLREAFRAKAQERRYLQAFRAQHFDFLKRYAELKNRITELSKK